MASILFRETTTIGVRRSLKDRWFLKRDFFDVETEFGTIKVKCTFLEGKCVNAKPEYDVCCEAAELFGAPLKEVQASASAAAWSKVSDAENCGQLALLSEDNTSTVQSEVEEGR